jgi:nucleoid-associated protein YgaU
MLDAGREAIYVVRPGDTLWEIAEALLGSGATEAAIAREVSRLWERNRDRIASGSPALIRPGERLLLR